MNYKEAAEKLEGYMIEKRRYFHAHPELSFKEYKTTEKLGQLLEELGLTPRYFKDYNGVWAEIRGEKACGQAKTVVLRADIDALPVTEHTGLPFASEEPGVMHACGHDCHMAMLLGAAKLLWERKSALEGTVRIFFQAAEESCHGAEYYVENGFMEGVDAIFGMHVWGDFDAPYFSLEDGPRMASCDNFTIEITGKSSHGSAPNLGTDAIAISAQVITALQNIVSRNNNPLNPLVITIGEITGGEGFNIIAKKVVMKGTTRTHSKEMRMQTEGLMRRTIGHVAAAMGGEGKLEFEYYPGPIINEDESLNTIARNAAVKLYGEECLKPLPKMMGSEDFAYFMEKAPGFYGYLGSRNRDLGYTATNHNDCYTVDESILKRGAALYAQFAHDFLSHK